VVAEKPGSWNRFAEWFVSHALWEALVACIGLLVSSIAGARLMHAAADTALNLFLVGVGLLGVAWAIGLLPIRRGNEALLLRGLTGRYQALILAWTQLDNLYRNSPKDARAPQTLPDPMGSRQIGDLDFRYQIGVLQGMTHALLGDLARAGIDIGYAEADIRSIPELLTVLARCKL